MIHTSEGWVQYDSQIGTFRGKKGDFIYGDYTGQYKTAEELLQVMRTQLSPELLEELKSQFILNPEE